MFGVAPNITGKLARQNAGTSDGPFYGAPNYSSSNVCGDWNGAYAVLFDASRISSIYGNSGAVQPQALRFLPLIKT